MKSLLVGALALASASAGGTLYVQNIAQPPSMRAFIERTLDADSSAD